MIFHEFFASTYDKTIKITVNLIVFSSPVKKRNQISNSPFVVPFWVGVRYKNCVKIYSPTPFDAAKALKLEEEFTSAVSAAGAMTMSMYPSAADKMKMGTPSCFPGRYSPTYRGPTSDQMRRCMTNPSVSKIAIIS